MKIITSVLFFQGEDQRDSAANQLRAVYSQDPDWEVTRDESVRWGQDVADEFANGDADLVDIDAPGLILTARYGGDEEIRDPGDPTRAAWERVIEQLQDVEDGNWLGVFAARVGND